MKFKVNLHERSRSRRYNLRFQPLITCKIQTCNDASDIPAKTAKRRSAPYNFQSGRIQSRIAGRLDHTDPTGFFIKRAVMIHVNPDSQLPIQTGSIFLWEIYDTNAFDFFLH